MAKKRIIDLPNLTSGSVNTILVGHDNGTTFQIALNVLTASVVEMLSQSTDARLDFLEEFQSDFYLISASIDTKIAAATNEQSLAHLVTTSSFNSFTRSYTTDSASFSSRIDAATNEQSLAHLATTGSNTFVGNQKITGSVSILIPGGTAYAINENPTPNNEFWAYIVQYPDAQNVAVGWTAAIVGGSTYTVTAVNYQHPFNKITLSDGSLQMGYRIGINFSKTSKLWEFNSNGTLTGLPDGLVSGSSQISDLGFVTGSYTTITSFNNLTQSFNQISQSFTTISGSFGDIDFSGINAVTESYLTFTQSYYSASASFDSRITNSQPIGYLTTASYSTDSASFNSRIISGSAVAGTISSSAQISAFGFISSSQTINTSSFATTGSNSFSGSQNITGSLIVSAVAVVNGGITIPTGSVLSLTSGSSISVDASGSITGSLTGSVFGIGDVVAFSSSVNSRIISGSAVAGTISGSSQIAALGYATTSSLNTLSTSVDSRLDTLEATIISGSPNYTQVLGNRRTSITTTGVSIISGSITTTGNPVQIMVTGDANPIGGTAWARLQIFRDGNAIGNIIHVENANNLNVPYCLNVIDTPSAGTYTYSMRTTDSIAGTLDFGEVNGPLLTVVELRTNTNLPSTNNVFTGTNRFNGQVTIGGVGGDEGGELQLVTAQTNTTLTGSYASVDIYRDRLRIFEGGGTFRGVHVDLSKAPGGVAGELIWKTSGFVNAGTFLTLDNLKVSVTTGGNRGLSVGAVSTNFTANIAGWYGLVGGGSGYSANNIGYGTTGSTSAFSWSFPTEGDTSQYNILDKTNSRFYRVTLMIGAGYNDNFISIERLF